MAFADSSLQTVSNEVVARVADAGRLTYVLFSEDEYEVLLGLARSIVSGRWAHQQARLVFLAFACAHARRFNLTKEEAFWPPFEEAMGLDSYEDRGFITESLLWPAYGEYGIDRIWLPTQRQFVRSLLNAVWQDHQLGRDELFDILRWYHQTRPSAESDLIQAYEHGTKKKLRLFASSLPALRRHCEVFAVAVELALEEQHGESLAWSVFRARLNERLSGAYNLARYPLLNDESAFWNLLLELQRHVTPHQFLSILHGDESALRVGLPDGRRLPRREVLARGANGLPFGRYEVHGDAVIDYRVVPMQWVALDAIGAWPIDTLHHLRERGVGYRSRRPFKVTRGHQHDTSSPLLRPGARPEYVWAGVVPRGRTFLIDGQPIADTEGLAFSTSAVMVEEEPAEEGASPTFRPALALESLHAYVPGREGAVLRLSVEGATLVERPLRRGGVLELHWAGSVPLSKLGKPALVRVELDGEPVEERQVHVDAAILCSLYTRRRIPPTEQRSWGDDRYVLFSAPDQPVDPSDALTVELLSEGQGGSAHRITWGKHQEPFRLAAAGLRWRFERPRYVYAELRTSAGEGPLQLQSHQCFAISDVNVAYHTNLTADDRLSVRLTYDEGVIATLPLRPRRTTGEQWLDVATLKTFEFARQGRLGRFVLAFRQGGDTVFELPLEVLPELQVSEGATADLHLEGASVPLTVRIAQGAAPLLWDSTQESATATLETSFTVGTERTGAPLAGHAGLQARQGAQVWQDLLLPDLDVVVPLRFRPHVFGFRLYAVRTGAKGRREYVPLGHLDYYGAERALLHVFGPPGASFEVGAGLGRGRFARVLNGTLDEQGQAAIGGLDALRDLCDDRVTPVEVRCGDLRTTFDVLWPPRVEEIRQAAEGIVCTVSGPPELAFLALWMDCDGRRLHETALCCAGRDSPITVPWPKSDVVPHVHEVALAFPDGNGSETLASRRIRVENNGQDLARLGPWLPLGLGLSSETLLALETP